jgi:hypothetical protein
MSVGEIRVESGKQSQGTPCFFKEYYDNQFIFFLLNKEKTDKEECIILEGWYNFRQYKEKTDNGL